MKKLMSKFKVLTVFVAAFFMVLALPARSEAAAAYKLINGRQLPEKYASSTAPATKMKVGKYYFWAEQDRNYVSTVYCSKSAAGADAKVITKTNRGEGAGNMLTNGTYIWFVESDVYGYTDKLYRCKMNGKGKTLYKKFSVTPGRGITLWTSRGNTVYYSIYGNKGGDTVLYSLSVKSKNGSRKKLKTMEVCNSDGGRYIYSEGKKSTVALQVYDTKTKKVKSVKKSKKEELCSVYDMKVSGSKMYFSTRVDKGEFDDTYNVYSISLNGANKKKIAGDIPENVYEINKVTSSYIYFRDFFSHGWKYDRANKSCEELDRTTYAQEIQ